MGLEWPLHGFWLLVCAFALGVAYQRIFEYLIGVEYHGETHWVYTIGMSLWIAFPLGGVTLLLIFSEW